VVFTDSDLTPQARSNVIYAVPLPGGNSVQLSNNSESAYGPLIGPNSDRVLFYAWLPNSTTCEESNLYSVQIFGGGRRALSAQCGTRGSVQEVVWSADGSLIVYLVDHRDAQYQSAGFELFVSDGQPIQPTQTPIPTATPAPAERAVYLPLVRR
jgi:hypothetical protein